MAGRERRVDRAVWLMRRDLAEVGAELRAARLAAGLTLRDVADAGGVSPSVILRTENGVPPGPRPERLASHAAAVGMRPRIRVFPEGEPLRDAAQLALLARLRARLGDQPMLLEQAVTSDPSDRRAFDALVALPGCRCALELITRLHDCQAQLRQLLLKKRDGGVDRLVVVIAATRHNRRALSVVADVLAATLPVRSRHVLTALAAGRDPGHDAIALL
jgi:transcriptional regulator with XRE-family HTH domain